MNCPLEFSNVCLARGSFQLQVPELRFAEGEIVGLVGNNGAGKSTLLDVAAGILQVDEGAVRTFGLDPVVNPIPVRAKVGWVTDDMALFTGTVERNMSLIAPFYSTWDWDLARQLLKRLNVASDRRVNELSKGEGTRLRLVLGMAFRPSLLLLDEPSTGLDVPSRRALYAELLRESEGRPKTVVIASHQLEDLDRICDRIVILDRGKVVADGTPDVVRGAWGTLEERLVATFEAHNELR